MAFKNFRDELRELINRLSMEAREGGNTPDVVLARFLDKCLSAFGDAVVERDHLCAPMPWKQIGTAPKTKNDWIIVGHFREPDPITVAFVHWNVHNACWEDGKQILWPSLWGTHWQPFDAARLLWQTIREREEVEVAVQEPEQTP